MTGSTTQVTVGLGDDDASWAAMEWALHRAAREGAAVHAVRAVDRWGRGRDHFGVRRRDRPRGGRERDGGAATPRPPRRRSDGCARRPAGLAVLVPRARDGRAPRGGPRRRRPRGRAAGEVRPHRARAARPLVVPGLGGRPDGLGGRRATGSSRRGRRRRGPGRRCRGDTAGHGAGRAAPCPRRGPGRGGRRIRPRGRATRLASGAPAVRHGRRAGPGRPGDVARGGGDGGGCGPERGRRARCGRARRRGARLASGADAGRDRCRTRPRGRRAGPSGRRHPVSPVGCSG